MKKHNIKLRLISVLMAVSMLLTLYIPMSAMAVTDSMETSSQVQNNESEQTSIREDMHTNVTEILSSDALDLAVIPDIIGEQKARESGHVNRLYSEEKDLNTVVFANYDGTKTAYYYNYPVKYTDVDGSIKDISLEIEPHTELIGAYVSADNKIQTVFPAKMTDGIMLSDTDVSIKLVPVFNNEQGGLVPITPTPLDVSTISTGSSSTSITSQTFSPVAELSDKMTVVYEYDTKTSYEYSLTYLGFKEDIVVSEYTGQTEYTFTLYTNGLSLSADSSGKYYLYDSDGNIKASVGNIVIFTADEQNNTFGTLTAHTVEENEEYVLTIHIDADYLADEKTLYPIRIDPTIEISYDNNGTGAIEDVTINNAETVSGTSGTISTGKYGDDQSVSRMLMKFPNVNFSSMGTITSATVLIRMM